MPAEPHTRLTDAIRRVLAQHGPQDAEAVTLFIHRDHDISPGYGNVAVFLAATPRMFEQREDGRWELTSNGRTP